MADTCFRMKGTTLTSIVLEVVNFQSDSFESQLTQKVASAPQFFTRSSLILYLLEALTPNQFESLVALCRKLQLQPMAVKGEVGNLKPLINQLGLADVSQSKLSDNELKPPSVDAARSAHHSNETSASAKSNDAVSKEQAASESDANQSAANASDNETTEASEEKVSAPTVAEPCQSKPVKVISRPVRSGQQVYAQGGDLVIAASVSEGAEILADGNIHVYGTLRGRALAGVKGDTGARVFCQSLEAELISVAGQFVMHDTIKGECWKQPAHVYLDEETLHIEPLA